MSQPDTFKPYGRGLTDVLTPAAPAAGSNYSFTVGSQNVDGLIVRGVLATLTTDANAANRLFSLDFRWPRYGTVLRHAATTLITANTSATVFQWDQAHTVSEWNTSTPVFVPLTDILLTPGVTVQLTVDSIQAGDTITVISFVLEKFYADS